MVVGVEGLMHTISNNKSVKQQQLSRDSANPARQSDNCAAQVVLIPPHIVIVCRTCKRHLSTDFYVCVGNILLCTCGMLKA